MLARSTFLGLHSMWWPKRAIGWIEFHCSYFLFCLGFRAQFTRIYLALCIFLGSVDEIAGVRLGTKKYRLSAEVHRARRRCVGEKIPSILIDECLRTPPGEAVNL